MPSATVTSIPAVYRDSIIVYKDKLYRVKRVNAKSLSITDVEGRDFKLSLPSDLAWRAIELASDEQAEAFRGQEFAEATQPAQIMRVGNIVRWPGARHPLAKGRFLVVTKVNAEGAANLSPLGGVLTGEYFRSVPARLLEKVEGPVTVTNV